MQELKLEQQKGDLDFADKLWKAADRLRGRVESSEYKHIVLGLIFLKYISDAFQNRRRWLEQAVQDPNNPEYYIPDASSEDIEAVVEDRDEYLAANVFWVPKEARWETLLQSARQPDISKRLDTALDAIEKANPQLRGILPKIYARVNLDPHILGELLNLFSQIGFNKPEDIAKDILGRVYEYFIGKFAEKEGKRGGEFFTPRCVVNLIVEMLEPLKGRIFDPACGSGGMFVQSIKFIEAHGGQKRNISIFGQESMEATWRICKMNLAIRGIEGNIQLGDSLLDDKHPDLRADYVMANPPFNMKDWGEERLSKHDPRLEFGRPPARNANYMWIQHFIHHLAPNGMAGFVLANGSLSVGGVEGEIRKRIIEADLVECIVALPPQLFYTTQIPACLWFIAKGKANGRFQNRRGQTLFIDARKMGVMIDRVHRELTQEEIRKIAGTYHAWRGEADAGKYQDIPGFCKSATLDEIRQHGYVLTPGRYVGAVVEEGDDEPFDQKMQRLTAQLRQQMAEARRLDEAIWKNLKELGYGG
ncbi:MAG: class I SAM-dependent DNA methyltransferase [Candidatus Caldarchaeum sp.]